MTKHDSNFKYKANIEYTEATMDTPFCTVQGVRHVKAKNEKDAIKKIQEDAYRCVHENFRILNISVVEGIL